MDPTSLPDDIIFNEIIPRLNPGEIRKLCQTNSRMLRMCGNPEVWKNRIRAEFPGFVNRGGKDYDDYLRLKSISLTPIYYNGDIIDEMLIYNSNFPSEISRRNRNIPKDSLLFLLGKNNEKYVKLHTITNFIEDGFPFEAISVIVVTNRDDYSKVVGLKAVELLMSSRSKVPIYKIGSNITDLRGNYVRPYIFPIGLPCNLMQNIHLEEILDFITKQSGGIMLREARSKNELCRQINLELAKIGHRF